jgi:molybdopterin converting factor small subunit
VKIKVKFFGRSQGLIGKEEVEADIEEGATVGNLALKLAEGSPGLAEDFHTLMIAVNAEQADWEYRLREGDEVHFISTLGGG